MMMFTAHARFLLHVELITNVPWSSHGVAWYTVAVLKAGPVLTFGPDFADGDGAHQPNPDDVAGDYRRVCHSKCPSS